MDPNDCHCHCPQPPDGFAAEADQVALLLGAEE